MSETITVNQAGTAVNVTGVEIEKGTKGGEYILLTVPGFISFQKAVQDVAASDFRELGGQWLGMSSKWRFSADKEMSVRRLCTSLFGWHCWKDNGLSPAVQALMSKPSPAIEAPSPQTFVLGCGSISPYNGVAVTLEYSKRPGKDRIVVNVSEKDIDSEDDDDAESRVANFTADAELLGGRFNTKYDSWSFLPVQQSLVEKLLFDWFGPGEDAASSYKLSSVPTQVTMSSQTLTASSDGETKQFLLWLVPFPDTLQVHMNGLKQREGQDADFTLDGRAITFNQPPPKSACIDAVYRS